MKDAFARIDYLLYRGLSNVQLLIYYTYYWRARKIKITVKKLSEVETKDFTFALFSINQVFCRKDRLHISNAQ